MEKVCFKCKEEKNLSEFYKHSKMKDGYTSRCKECTKEDVSNYRSNNLEKVRAYDRKRGNFPHRVAARLKYAKTVNGKVATQSAKDNWVGKNKIKHACHVLFGNAVRDRRVIKEPCRICGSSEKVHGHHDDYMKPLEVKWFCPKHHSRYHQIIRNWLRRQPSQ